MSCGVNSLCLSIRCQQILMKVCVSPVHIKNVQMKTFLFGKKKNQETEEYFYPPKSTYFLLGQLSFFLSVKKVIGAAMVQIVEQILAFCARLANRADFLADRGLTEEKFSRIMGGKSIWAIFRRTRTSWHPVCCVSLGQSGPLAWKLQERGKKIHLFFSCTRSE